MYKKICKKYGLILNDNNIIQNYHEKRICNRYVNSRIIKENLKSLKYNLNIDILINKTNNNNLILDVLDDIVSLITSYKVSYYTEVFILNCDDFEELKPILTGNEDMKYDGINLNKQNIIITHNNLKLENILQLLFHEIGHSMRKVGEVFKSESMAMMFEFKCMDKLVDILNVLDGNMNYSATHVNYQPKGTIHYEAMEYALKHYKSR